LNGVDDIGGAKRDVNVGHIVLVKKSGIMRGDAHAEDADVGVFKHKMMMWLFRDGNGHRSLGAERKCEKEQDRA
jgi:hypothetical protein